MQYRSLLRVETRKLFSHKKYIVLLCLLAVMTVLYGLVVYLIDRLSGGIRLSVQTLPMNSFFQQLFAPLLCFMLCSDLFAGEFADQTIRALLLRPISRWQLYLGKLTAAALMLLTYSMAMALCGAILQLLPGGHPGKILYIFYAYLLDFLALLPLLAMAGLLAQLGTGTSMYLFLCIIVYIVLWAAASYLPHAGSVLFTALLQWHTLWTGSLLPFGALISKVGLMLGSLAALGCGGYMLFEKKEV